MSEPWSTEHALGLIGGLEEEIGKVIVGQSVLIRRLLTGLFAAIPYATADSGARVGCGHVLLEGVPGVAKTLTATTLARALIRLTARPLPSGRVLFRIGFADPHVDGDHSPAIRHERYDGF